MRKLKLEMQISLDGYLADVAGKTDWMTWNWGADWKWDATLQQYHMALAKSADHFFISRQMAEEGFNAHWRNATQDRSDPRFEFAKHIVDARKTVFSTTLNKSDDIPGGWENNDLIGSDYIAYVNELKRHPGKDIIVCGGATLVSSLMKADLIDEFFFIVNPVAIGKGMSIFNERLSLNLADAIPFPCGVVVLHYRR